ncbi:MAG: sulfatase [Polyangiaceae bacterium]|nr:sulfatase [Polyangiaceae bacterium]
MILLLCGAVASTRSAEQQVVSAGIAAVIFALMGATLGACAYAALRACQFPTLRAFAWARRVYILLMSVYVFLWILGETFLVSTGAPLTIGSLEFLAAGWRHLFSSLAYQYAWQIFVALAAAVFITWLAARLVRRQEQTLSAEPCPQSLALRGFACLLALSSVLALLLQPQMAESGQLCDTPEISLLASIAERKSVPQELAGQRVKVTPGPSRQSEALWLLDRASKVRLPERVVLIQLESVGVDHLGYMGYRREGRSITPHLDELAKASANWIQARTTATHSNYAQMATLSSLFPRRGWGLDTYGELDYPRVLWHDFLMGAGFETVTFSSQDESWQGMLLFEKTHSTQRIEHAGNFPGEKIDKITEKVVPDHITVERGLKWLKEQGSSAAVYFNFQATHFPYSLPAAVQHQFLPDDPHDAEFNYLYYSKELLPIVQNRYDNALAYVDQQVGRVLQSLRERHQLENTLVVVTADHGELFWQHGLVTHGRTLFDGESRVPLLIHWPAAFGPQVSDTVVSTLDILPTLAALFGELPHPAWQGTPLLNEQGEMVSFQSNGPGAHPAVFMNIQGMKSWDGLICGEWKLMEDRSSDTVYLFHLGDDPKELHNLAHQRPEVRDRLHAYLQTQMQAQMSYHADDNQELRADRFAPRLLSCPSLESEGIARSQSLETTSL